MEQEAPGAAARFLEAVEASLERVREMPEIGSPRELDNPRLQGLRSWPVFGFEAVRVYYLATDDAIRVIRVLHGKRDLASILDREAGD
jgi:plasmid stabilization system protein ParE